MTRVGPHYPLDEVKQLVAAGDFMMMKGRALNLLVPPLTYAQAIGFIATASQALWCSDGEAPTPNLRFNDHMCFRK